MLNRIKRYLNNLAFEEKMDELFDSLNICELNIYIGSDLVPYAKEICNKIWELRENIKNKTGLVLPPVKIRNCNDFQENEYEICMRENVLYKGYTVPDREYAKNEICYNLETVFRENFENIISNKTIEKYIRLVQKENSWLIWEISRYLNIVEIKHILLGIVKNNCSIKDITYTFELIAKHVIGNSSSQIISKVSDSLLKFDWDIKMQESGKYKLPAL